MADKERTKGPFDDLLGLKSDDPELEGAKDGAQGGEPGAVPIEDFNKLKTELDDLKKSSAGNNQKLEQIEKNNEVISRIRDIFVPKDPKDQGAAERKKMLDAFDENPIEFLEKFVENKVAPVAENLHKVNVDRFAKEVINEIDREYSGIDWAKDGKKIADELKKVSTEYKQKDPKGATELALKMAGIGKKRETPADFPYYEPSTIAAAVAKQRRTEADEYKKGIFDAAKKENADVLKGFFQK